MLPKPEFFGSTIISDKGQVVIPVEARNALGLEKGEKLLVMGMSHEAIMLVRADSFEKMAAEMASKAAAINKSIKKEGRENE